MPLKRRKDTVEEDALEAEEGAVEEDTLEAEEGAVEEDALEAEEGAVEEDTLEAEEDTVEEDAPAPIPFTTPEKESVIDGGDAAEAEDAVEAEEDAPAKEEMKEGDDDTQDALIIGEKTKVKDVMEGSDIKAVIDHFYQSEDLLKGAKEFLNKAEININESSYEDSYLNSEEAIQLAKSALRQFEQIKIRLEKIKQEELASKKKVDAVAAEKAVKIVEEPEEKPELGEGWKTYTVRLLKRRDCLWRIAKYNFIYSNPLLWKRIYKANKDKIKNPHLIYPGQVLRVPPKKGAIDVKEYLKQKDKQEDTDAKKEGKVKTLSN